jgi:hypothetical protein
MKTNKIMRAYNKVAGCYGKELKRQINAENYDSWFAAAGIVLGERWCQNHNWQLKANAKSSFTGFDSKINGSFI